MRERRYSTGVTHLDFAQLAYPELLPQKSRSPSIRFSKYRHSRKMSFASLQHEPRPTIDTNVHYYPNGSGQSYCSPADLTVEPITPLDEESGEEDEEELVTAMHEYKPDMPAATCLSFKAGQVIRVLNKDATGWWDGELVEPYPLSSSVTRGWFPSNYVSADPIQLAFSSTSNFVSSYIF